jgi:hypothetical protein
MMAALLQSRIFLSVWIRGKGVKSALEKAPIKTGKK